MGVMAFFMDLNMSTESLAQLSNQEREFRSGFPMWTKVVYGIATFGGTIGCIGLLLKKSWARALFGISLAGVLLQFGFAFGRMAKYDMLSIAAAIMPSVVILGAIALLLHANTSVKKGWLN